MAYSLTQFENNTTNELGALDNNFTTTQAALPIPCLVAGTNALTFTQSPAGQVPTTPITAYSTNMQFSGIAAATNTGAVTATVGAIGALNVYKDGPSGPVALTGGEIVALCAFTLRYDAALNSGAGGFHLISTTANSGIPATPSSVQVNGGATLTALLSGTVALTFTATPGWSSQDQTFTLAGLPPAIPAVGDFVQVVPPSLGAAGVGYSGMVQTVGSLSSTSSVATLSVRLLNAASASLASNSGVYRWTAMRTVP